jgi:hypothetical protein
MVGSIPQSSFNGAIAPKEPPPSPSLIVNRPSGLIFLDMREDRVENFVQLSVLVRGVLNFEMSTGKRKFSFLECVRKF